MKRTVPPQHLREPTRKWWADVNRTYELLDHHRRLLTLAGEAWDRGQQARELLLAKGVTYDDRYGCPHPRPEVAIERDARIAFARLIRELGLDHSTPAEESSRSPRVVGRGDRRAL